MDLETTRGRLYLLTKVAAVIQAENFTRDDNPQTNPDITYVKSAPSDKVQQAKLLNHLAVLFSCGVPKERNRVATYAGPVLSQKLTAVVVSPASTDEKQTRLSISPRGSPSSQSSASGIEATDITANVIEEELATEVHRILEELKHSLSDYHSYVRQAMCVLRHTHQQNRMNTV